MQGKQNNIANRVLIAGDIAVITTLVLFGAGATMARLNPEGRAFISLKLFFGLVFIAVFIGDRIYVSRNKP